MADECGPPAPVLDVKHPQHPGVEVSSTVYITGTAF